jgi:hypothetical protein
MTELCHNDIITLIDVTFNLCSIEVVGILWRSNGFYGLLARTIVFFNLFDLRSINLL